MYTVIANLCNWCLCTDPEDATSSCLLAWWKKQKKQNKKTKNKKKTKKKNNHYPKTASLADSDSCGCLTQMSWSWTKKSTKIFKLKMQDVWNKVADSEVVTKKEMATFTHMLVHLSSKVQWSCSMVAHLCGWHIIIQQWEGYYCSDNYDIFSLMSHKLDDQVAVCLLLGNAWLLEPLQPQ